ncbi:MAG: NAD(P) transhydrogenase subunit alpha [Alphaproteobacteria bacterium RIFCSPHIGHO2_12_FULL_63_12]|nr:MAG: NAD(P) transhydrogenase subunit alpha [Alphaproteobacteria bacterium RIFCSPHIGHO2_12_FULL_63_12]
MKIAVLRETRAGESRVAASPETVKKFAALGASVSIERGAGEGANYLDHVFSEAGATISGTLAETISGADLIIGVRAPAADSMNRFQRGQKIVAIVSPHSNGDVLQAAAGAGVDLFAMDLMPRITRAQSMDVLSSQSNLAGYKAVIDAAAYYGRAIPMMMTAAGTIAPAKMFIMGAGVAGLQAIATARRLGGVVSATDVRWAAKEQVESLGASFVTVDEEAMKGAETSGGYAKEMSADFQRRQAEFVGKHIAKQNIVVTTALIPGRPAPRLVTEEMVRSMAPGSVIVDLAVEQGGNVALSRRGEVIDVGGVIIIGFENVPGRLATDASSLYAKNLFNFVAAFFDKEKKEFVVDENDDIIKGVALTRAGAIIHPNFIPAPIAGEGATHG